jgi:hypothetical protein
MEVCCTPPRPLMPPPPRLCSFCSIKPFPPLSPSVEAVFSPPPPQIPLARPDVPLDASSTTSRSDNDPPPSSTSPALILSHPPACRRPPPPRASKFGKLVSKCDHFLTRANLNPLRSADAAMRAEVEAFGARVARENFEPVKFSRWNRFASRDADALFARWAAATSHADNAAGLLLICAVVSTYGLFFLGDLLSYGADIVPIWNAGLDGDTWLPYRFLRALRKRSDGGRRATAIFGALAAYVFTAAYHAAAKFKKYALMRAFVSLAATALTAQICVLFEFFGQADILSKEFDAMGNIAAALPAVVGVSLPFASALLPLLPLLLSLAFVVAAIAHNFATLPLDAQVALFPYRTSILPLLRALFLAAAIAQSVSN